MLVQKIEPIHTKSRSSAVVKPTLTDYSLARRALHKAEPPKSEAIAESVVVQGCVRVSKFCDCEVCRPEPTDRRHCVPTEPVRVYRNTTPAKAEAAYRELYTACHCVVAKPVER